jgi:drug/metabolite transporter (DMT)-like permease
VRVTSSDVHRAVFARGVFLAVVAALAFGATTPFIARGQDGGSPIATACLLYAGAAAAALAARLGRRGAGDARLQFAHVPRLVLVAAFGAVIAPVALAWGLPRTGPTAGSLLLCLEAVFTALLAWLVHREPIGRRVALALALMTAAGALLAAGALGGARIDRLGLAAIAAATLAWASDNVLTRPLADVDPLSVVAVKGLFGAFATGLVALAGGLAWPSGSGALLLLACGATGYGLSLRFYLLAQRRIGTGRTGSLFALAPFFGAALSFALGDRSGGLAVAAAGALFAVGVFLHASERHAHHHEHEPMAHEHMHRHDDGHHDHVHDPPVDGAHSHPHDHAAMGHSHEHAPDLHHTHGHGRPRRT